MGLLKSYWRSIAFAAVCLASLGMGGWAYMAGGAIEEKMRQVDQVRMAVERDRANAANRRVIEAKEQEVAAANAEFETSMNAALSLQLYNAFESKVGPDGKIVPAPRKTLIDNVLPKPSSTADAISFKAAYERAFAELAEKLNARDKATTTEIREYAEQMELFKEASRSGGSRPWGPVVAGSTQDPGGEKNERSLAEILRDYPKSRLAEEIARKIYMYVDQDAFGKSDIARNDGAPDEVAIWHAQMSLWIQQDAAVALSRCNEERAQQLRAEGHPDRLWVAYMPVKRVMRMAIDNRLGNGGGSNDRGGFGTSFTSIDNDDKKFVVPIGLELVVEEAAIPKVLEMLCTVGFYTPVSVRYEAVRPSPIQDEYIYGEAPVVELRIELEGYFFRKVFDQWIPKSLANTLKLKGAQEDRGRG